MAQRHDKPFSSQTFTSTTPPNEELLNHTETYKIHICTLFTSLSGTFLLLCDLITDIYSIANHIGTHKNEQKNIFAIDKLS
jgi:hypothetical protein